MFHEHTLYIYIHTHIFWYSQLSCQPPHSSRTMVSSLPDLVQHQRRQATAALHVDGFPTPHNDRGKLWTCRWRMLKITDLLDGIHCHGHDCAIYPAEDCSWPEIIENRLLFSKIFLAFGETSYSGVPFISLCFQNSAAFARHMFNCAHHGPKQSFSRLNY